MSSQMDGRGYHCIHTYIGEAHTYLVLEALVACCMHVGMYMCEVRLAHKLMEVPRSRYVSTQHTTHRSIICTHLPLLHVTKACNVLVE